MTQIYQEICTRFVYVINTATQLRWQYLRQARRTGEIDVRMAEEGKVT